MNDNKLSALDRVLIYSGADKLRRDFRVLASSDRDKALWYLEDEKLLFPSFFTVLPEISSYGLSNALGSRNYAAAGLCAQKLKKMDSRFLDTGAQDSETLYQALRWMFDTGKDWDPPSRRNDYESVIDYVSALLVITFEDVTILPDIARLIFKRRRRGRLIHDLVWCFFQTLDYDALIYVAGQLLSSDTGDAALAGKLLCLDGNSASRAEIKELHRQYVGWLNDNRPYLYVTGEHFQQTSRPKHLSVDMEAKYLGKELSPRYRAPVAPLNAHEIACLHEYRGFLPEEQEMLTDYSHRLRQSDARSWEDWMQKQVAEQVIAAKSGYEVL